MRELVRRAQRIARVITGVFMILISILLFGYSIELNLNRDERINVIEDPEPDFFKKLEEKRFGAFKVETNKASNEAGKESEYEDPEPLASLESLEAGKDYSKMAAEMAAGSGIGALSQEIEDRINRMKENAPPKGQPIKLAKRTTISYNLKGRVHRELPVPVYKCLEGGEIVINVAVDNRGSVIDAWFSPEFSSTSNGCLVDNAIEYAKLSRFQESGKPYQEGTITYLFPAKED